MNQKEWLGDIGAAAEDLGYGIVSITPDEVELLSRQEHVRIRVESRLLSGDLLRSHLTKVEHRSGSAYTPEYRQLSARRVR